MSCQAKAAPVFMMTRTSFLLLFLFSILGLKQMSQTLPLDSLKNAISVAENDTKKIEAINRLMLEYAPASREYTAYNKWIGRIILYNLKYRNLDLRTKKNMLALLGYWYINKAVELFSQEKKEEVLACCDHAVFLFSYLGVEDDMWSAMSNRAAVLREMGRYEEAISSLYAALKYHESTGNDYGVSLVNMQLTAIYEDQDDYANAIIYYKKMLKYQESIKNPDGIDMDQMIRNNSGIGSCYYHLGKYDEARRYFYRALELAKEHNILHNVSFCYMFLGNVYTREKDYDKAEANFKLALHYAESDRAKSHLWQSWAQMYYQQENYALAESYYEAAASLQEHSGEYHKARVATYEGLYKTYEARHEFKKAFDALSKYQQAMDSTKIESSRNAIARQQLKYEYEKKELRTRVKQEQRLSVLKLENAKKNSRKNMILYGLIFLALILCVSMFYLYKFFQQKNIINAGKNNELKQKLLRAQMNPHFIFNSVDTIQSLIHNKQGKEAISYLSKFSRLTRQILENSNENYISLGEELAMTENYLGIQQLLYNTKFTYRIEVDEALDPEAILIPPMLTQPFIENAIKHGLKRRENGGFVHIRFYKKGEALFFEVRDNGSGIEAKKTSDAHKSMSLTIVNERLNNNPSKKEIAITMENVIENNEVAGARTSFEIPYIYEN